MNSITIQLRNVVKKFGDTTALDDVSLRVMRTETVGIIGRSGSGKSTLLNIMAGLTGHSEGDYEFDGAPFTLNDGEENGPIAVDLRRKTGYINQASDLLSNFSVLRNLEIAASLSGQLYLEDVACNLLNSVDLKNCRFLDRKCLPHTLSGGERQRVNIARSIIKNPKIIFADEPTGALDVYTGEVIIDLLIEQAKKDPPCALILVTHDPKAAAKCDRQLGLVKGRLELDGNYTAKELAEFIKNDPNHGNDGDNNKIRRTTKTARMLDQCS